MKCEEIWSLVNLSHFDLSNNLILSPLSKNFSYWWHKWKPEIKWNIEIIYNNSTDVEIIIHK